RHLQQRQVWINLAERLPKRRHHRDYGTSILSGGANGKINLAVVALGQRHKQPANNGVVLDVVPMFADDTDDLQVVRRAILWRLGIADMLTDGILVWEKFRRHFFVNDSDAARILVLAFGLRKIAAAQQLDAQGIEITGANRSVERIDSRVRRFGIVRHRVFRTNDTPGVSEIGIRQHRSHRGRPYTRQFPRAFYHRKYQPTRLRRLFFDEGEVALSDELAGRA